MPFTPTGTWYDPPAAKGPPTSSAGSWSPGPQPLTTSAGSNKYSRTSANVLTAYNQLGGMQNYTPGDYQGFSDTAKAYMANPAGMNPQTMGPGGDTGDGGSGGGWGGGGGGGGGVPAMTQAQFDMYLKVLGQAPPDLDLAELPRRANRIRPFAGQMYNRMERKLGRATRGDRQSVNRQMNQLRGQLKADYSNPYASAEFAVTPQMQAGMQGLITGAGGAATGGEYAESVSAENAYGQNSDAAFGNLMKVLGASNQQEQQSRLAQVGMDRAEALRQINIQRMGLGAGIDMARGQAKEAWRTRADERRYQNMLRNQDVRNLERTTEYKTGVDMQTSREQALLDLIARTAGSEVNLGGIEGILNAGGTSTIKPVGRRGRRGRRGDTNLGRGKKGGKKMYAGGSKNFNERTGKYRRGTAPGPKRGNG